MIPHHMAWWGRRHCQESAQALKDVHSSDSKMRVVRQTQLALHGRQDEGRFSYVSSS